jgi:diguanylate cyclase (GGDEF)-like protein
LQFQKSKPCERLSEDGVWFPETIESSSRHSVLVVGDDPSCARAIRDLLASRRFEVEVVLRLERAVEALRIRPYDALLIHLALTDEGGRNSLFRAQMLAHRIPIVLLTGHPDEALGAQAVEAGIQEYLMLDREGRVPPDLDRARRHAAIRHRQARRSRRPGGRAGTDPATGLADRASFLRRLADLLAFAGRFREKPALLLLGLGHLGEARERLGSALGTRLLHEVGRRLTWCVRRADVLGRLGDEEIALLLPHAATPPAIRMVAERIRLAAIAPFEGVRLRANVGAAWYPQDGDTCDGLLQAAESALAGARELGDGGCQLFRGHDLPPWPEDVVKSFRLPEPDGLEVADRPAGAPS